jgi:hypothetical protein
VIEFCRIQLLILLFAGYRHLDIHVFGLY